MRIKYITSSDNRAHNFNKYIKSEFPEFLKEKNPDLILVAGGDGALHHAVQKHYHLNVPFLGKACGTLNFLMNEFNDEDGILDRLIKNKIFPSIYSFRNIAVSLNGQEIGEAVNDVIIGKSIMNYFKFNLTTKDKSLENFEVRGSGICMSTVIGSTAFNFNNNGNVLPLDSDLWSLTGVVCNRHLNDLIKPQKIEIESSGGKVFLSGIEKTELTKNDSLTLKKGSIVQLAFLDKKKFLSRRIEFANRYRIAK